MIHLNFEKYNTKFKMNKKKTKKIHLAPTAAFPSTHVLDHHNNHDRF
jgi:hypothetical protein